ncbi:MAG: alpha-glucan family phosphorylase [Chloroflexota bacterium]
METFIKPIPVHSGIPSTFDLPRRINRLSELAYNLWWAWNPDAYRLFIRIDKDLWEQVYHNPVRFLKQVERSALNAVTQDRYYLEDYDRVFKEFDEYQTTQDTWFLRTYPECKGRQIAYLSMEFGLSEVLPIYSGGLGVLSGDHIKEASDLGLPMVAVGLLYTRGYFSQRITEDGWQEKRDFELKVNNAPIIPVQDADGERITISIDLPGRSVLLQIWQVNVGRTPLYLLDSNVSSNAVADRMLTANLYSSNPEMRVSQEIILGIGGTRALRALGYNPSVWHMNEGHSAFLGLERLREFIEAGKSFDEAVKIVRTNNVFTTHTPIAAGNDEFTPTLIERYFAPMWQEMKLTRDQFFEIGKITRGYGDNFSMPVLAIHLSDQVNAVSELHGRVTRGMWQFLWPELDEEEVPITYVTNGVHIGTWLSRRLRVLFDYYLGKDWMDHMDEPETWDRVDDIPDAELWEVRMDLKRKLVSYVRENARTRWMQEGIHPIQAIASGVLLSPNALTIGFARRFAPYKRANLVLHDVDRLINLLNRPNRQLQIIFAGKSHPDDEPGKLIIQEVYKAVKKAENGGRIIFLEEYDINLARYLVAGVDVWMNTPRRPLEASGTSGQKAALNGVLNFSVLDGWWREGYNGKNGWAIGEDADPVGDPAIQDEADVKDLYNTLENEIIPLYYKKRSVDNLPGDWIAMIKESIRTLSPQFCNRRMVKEYVDRLYQPGLKSSIK